MSKSNQILFKNIFTGFMGFKKNVPMKGHNFRKFCLFHFFTLFQGQVMTCYYQVFDAHSMLVLHLEILYVEKNHFFFFKGNLKIAEKYFSFRKYSHLLITRQTGLPFLWALCQSYLHTGLFKLTTLAWCSFTPFDTV